MTDWHSRAGFVKSYKNTLLSNISTECNKGVTKITEGGKSKATVILKTERFDNIDSVVIISSVNSLLAFSFMAL